MLGDADSPALHVVVLGDSSVTAPGVHPLDHCWARRVAHHLATRYHVTLTSVAVGGTRAGDVLLYQVPAARAACPDMALISVGANDALRAVAVDDFERNLDAAVRALQETIPAVALSGLGNLGTLPRLPAIGRAWAKVRARSYDRAIARVAHRRRVPKTTAWGSMWDRFMDLDNESGIYAADLFHASGVGHELFAEAWFPVVDEMAAEVIARRESYGSSM